MSRFQSFVIFAGFGRGNVDQVDMSVFRSSSK